MRLVRRDLILLRSPRDRPVGEIWYREERGPMRTARSIAAQRPAPVAGFEATAIGAPERAVTDEGEHAAVVRIEGRLHGAAALRLLGLVATEHVTAMVDAITVMPEHFDELEAVARATTEHVTLGLGVRQRRFEFRVPDGWQAIPHGMTSRLIPGGHPQDPAAIEVYPAVPRGPSIQALIDSTLDDQLGAVAAITFGAEQAVRTHAGLTGTCWHVETESTRGDLRRHRVAVLEDDRYAYRIRHDVGERASTLAFEALLASVVGLPAPRRVHSLMRRPVRAPRDRIAVLGGFDARVPEAYEMTAALANLERYDRIDAVVDEVAGQPSWAVVPPGGVVHRREARDLIADPRPYHAIYAAAGHAARTIPHALRGRGHATPVVCELDLQPSPRTWMLLFTAARTGLVRASDTLVVPSDGARAFVAAQWARWGEQPCPELVVAPPGIDVDAYRRDPAARDAVGLAPRDVVIVDPTPLDRAGLALAWWREVATRMPGAALWLAGAGDRATLEAVRATVRAAGLAGRIVVGDAGFARPAILGAADVFLAVGDISVRDVLVAMAHGLVVVAATGSEAALVVRDGRDGVHVPATRTRVAVALSESAAGRTATGLARELAGHQRIDEVALVETLGALAGDADRRARLGAAARARVRMSYSVAQAAARRSEILDDAAAAAVAPNAVHVSPALVDPTVVVATLASQLLAPSTRVRAASPSGVTLVPQLRVERSRQRATAVLEALADGELTLEALATRIHSDSPAALGSLVARLVAYDVVRCEPAPPACTPEAAPSPPAPAGERAALAVLGGFTAWSEAAPHGTSHAAFAYTTAIAAARRFATIDSFHETVPEVVVEGVRMRAVRELPEAREPYAAIYVAHGDQLGYVPHVLRPRADWAPVICDVGTAHHLDQWVHLFVAAATGAVRPTDGFVFACHAARRLHEQVWGDWHARLGSAPMPLATVIENAVDPAAHARDRELGERTRTALGLSPTDVMVLSFGRLSASTKGDQLAAVAVWREVVRHAPHAVLVLAGAAEDFEHVERLRRQAREAGVADRVIVVENPYELWPRARTALMSAADALVHLSTGLEETASLVLLEAMAHELPVIATRWSGSPDLIRDGEEGCLVDTWMAPLPDTRRAELLGREPLAVAGELARFAACDAGQLVAATVALATQPERRRRMGVAARTAVVERHALATATRRRLDFVAEASRAAQAAWTGAPPPRVPLVDLDALLACHGLREAP